ncbi:MAG TPA: capsule biosynthesis protein CapA [Bacteroidales bacterium]|nr:capsule biosynthesis protein CapA [Bacteroidales bacterium]
MIKPILISTMKRDLCSILLYLVLLFFFCNDACPQVHEYLHVSVKHPAYRLWAKEKNVVITGVGDIMFGTTFPSARFLPAHDNPLVLLGDLADTLAKSDITFGNLEGSFLDEGEPAKKCRDTTICYLFRMPERYAGALAVAGFDILSLANNHFGDFGIPSRIRTMQLLDSLGIEYAGLIEKPYSIFSRGSLVYGFCAFAPNAGTVSIINIPEAEALVRKLKDTCDIVIVSFHGGAEGAEYQHVTRKEELFFGESRGNVYEFSHRMIDSGADVVFGHGPHVTRAIEVYRNRFIGYSLGNFCTYGRFNLSGPNGIAPVIILNINTSGKFLSGRIIPVFQVYNGGVRVDPEKRVIRKIKELTSADFPESVINISDNGEITYK